jgi:cytochrome c oxidase assembly protein subunit 15
MELSQFKSIFFMEWAHRQWGRAIGLTFALPALYFAVRGKMSRPIAQRAGLITGLIGLQVISPKTHVE